MSTTPDKQRDNANDMVLVGDTYTLISDPEAQKTIRRQVKRARATEKLACAETTAQYARKEMLWKGVVAGTAYAAADSLFNKAGIPFGTVWQTAVPVFAVSYYVLADVAGYMKGLGKAAAQAEYKKTAKQKEYLGIALEDDGDPLHLAAEKTRDTISALGTWATLGMIIFNANSKDMHLLPAKTPVTDQPKQTTYVLPKKYDNIYVTEYAAVMPAVAPRPYADKNTYVMS